MLQARNYPGKFRYSIMALVIGVIAFSSFAFFFKITMPSGAFSLSAYLKEGCLLGLLGVAFGTFLVKPKFIFYLPRLDLFLAGFIFLCFIYTIFSPMSKGEGLKAFLSICFGPLLFLFLNRCKVDYPTSLKIMKILYLWVLFLVLSGIIIYLAGEEHYYRSIGLFDFISEKYGARRIMALYRSKAGHDTIRMAGFLLAPLDMGFVLLFLTSFYCFFAKRIIHKAFFIVLWLVAVYLADVRSVLIGIFGAIILLWLIDQKKIKRIAYSFLILCACGIAGYLVFSGRIIFKGFDLSALIHLHDLVIRGPQMVVENWMGVGIGMTSGRLSAGPVPESFIGNIESFYYTLSIQIGILGLVLYLVILTIILSRIIGDRKNMRVMMNSKTMDRFYNGTFISIAAVHIGLIFLPVMDSKIISSLMWVLIFFALNMRRSFSGACIAQA
jgi:hypothetical protein